MLTINDVVKLKINLKHLKLCEDNAILACIGGISHIRSIKDRQNTLLRDNMVGQIGTLAGHLSWFGHIEYYIESRKIANANPKIGDKGTNS